MFFFSLNQSYNFEIFWNTLTASQLSSTGEKYFLFTKKTNGFQDYHLIPISIVIGLRLQLQQMKWMKFDLSISRNCFIFIKLFKNGIGWNLSSWCVMSNHYSTWVFSFRYLQQNGNLFSLQSKFSTDLSLLIYSFFLLKRKVSNFPFFFSA